MAFTKPVPGQNLRSRESMGDFVVPANATGMKETGGRGDYCMDNHGIVVGTVRTRHRRVPPHVQILPDE
jgi:hypothetical protein